METKLIPLHQIHERLGAKMIPFAGFMMPVRYSSDTEEHLAVRKSVGVFDVSHMGEFLISGPKALSLVQRVTSNDASVLQVGQAQYSYLPNEQGGIVDDLIVYRLDETEYMLVVNASNIEKDWNWITSNNPLIGAEMKDISDDTVLFAVQGPNASGTLQKLTDANLSGIKNYHFIKGKLAGVEMIISATGYTGAGGFELYIDKGMALAVWNQIFEAGKEFNIKPIGLGARDTLRLEMGYCLYGNDITDNTSPIEAGLGWVTKLTKDFVGAPKIRAQKIEGVSRKLIGFKMIEKGIPRSGYSILNLGEEPIGQVTSGTISPLSASGIGMGYVTREYGQPGKEILIEIRNKKLRARIEKPPFLT